MTVLSACMENMTNGTVKHALAKGNVSTRMCSLYRHYLRVWPVRPDLVSVQNEARQTVDSFASSGSEGSSGWRRVKRSTESSRAPALVARIRREKQSLGSGLASAVPCCRWEPGRHGEKATVAAARRIATSANAQRRRRSRHLSSSLT